MRKPCFALLSLTINTTHVAVTNHGQNGGVSWGESVQSGICIFKPNTLVETWGKSTFGNI